MRKQNYCTVTDFFYSPKALVLYLSLAAVLPLEEFRFFVLCLDAETENALGKLGFKNLFLLSGDQIPALAEIRDRPFFEFACATKPFLLEYLLGEKGLASICYFDADMFFLSSPAFLFGLLGRANVLLRPAISEPSLVEKDWNWVAVGSKYTGYYNAGFIGVSKRALPFVQWWKQLCIKSTSHEFDAYTYFDQRYLDYAPACFDRILLVRHNGCNFKHWMVKYGAVKRLRGRLYVGDEPVVFMHFSQNLGNITDYDPLLHPELRAYVGQLKAARRQLRAPYFSSQGHGASTVGAGAPTLSRSARNYLARIKWILPGRVLSGKLSEDVKLATTRTLAAHFHLSQRGSERVLRLVKTAHPIAPETFRLIQRKTAHAQGAIVMLGAMDGIPAIAAALTGRKITVVDSFEARYFAEGKIFINPKLDIFRENINKFRVAHLVELLRCEPNDLAGSQQTSSISCLVIDATFGNLAVCEYLARWLGAVGEGGAVICVVPKSFGAMLLELHSDIQGSFSGFLEKVATVDSGVLLYKRLRRESSPQWSSRPESLERTVLAS